VIRTLKEWEVYCVRLDYTQYEIRKYVNSSTVSQDVLDQLQILKLFGIFAICDSTVPTSDAHSSWSIEQTNSILEATATMMPVYLKKLEGNEPYWMQAGTDWMEFAVVCNAAIRHDVPLLYH